MVIMKGSFWGGHWSLLALDSFFKILINSHLRITIWKLLEEGISENSTLLIIGHG